MQIVNHCSFKKLTGKSTVNHFPFPCLFDSRWHCASKKYPIKPKKTTQVGLFLKKGFSEPWLEADLLLDINRL